MIKKDPYDSSYLVEDSESIVKAQLLDHGFLRVSHNLIMLLGLEPAALLTNLISQHSYLKENGKIKNKDDWFYNTQEKKVIYLGLSIHRQNKALEVLKELDMVKCKMEGLPRRQWFSLVFDNIRHLINIIDYITSRITLNSQYFPVFKILKTSIKNIKDIYNKNIANKIIDYFLNTKNSSKQIENLPSTTSLNSSNKKSKRTAPIKDNKNTQPIKKEIEDAPLDPLVEYWNGLPNIRKHKTGTKTYKRTLQLFRQLRTATLSTKNDLEPHIPLTTEQHKFTNNEIKESMLLLSHLLTPGYWPTNKKNLPIDLPTLIFNPRTRKSLLYYVWVNPPQLAGDKLLEEKKKKLTEDQKYLLQQCKDYIKSAWHWPPDKEILPDEEVVLVDLVIKGENFFNKLPSKCQDEFRGDCDGMLWYYITEFSVRELTDPSVTILRYGGKIWQWFLDWFSNFCNMDILTGEIL